MVWGAAVVVAAAKASGRTWAPMVVGLGIIIFLIAVIGIYSGVQSHPKATSKPP
jgi:hypothetical protein